MAWIPAWSSLQEGCTTNSLQVCACVAMAPHQVSSTLNTRYHFVLISANLTGEKQHSIVN